MLWSLRCVCLGACRHFATDGALQFCVFSALVALNSDGWLDGLPQKFQLLLCQRQLSSHIWNRFRVAFHPSVVTARVVSAQQWEMSPRRRGKNSYGIFFAQTLSNALTTCITVLPAPEPRLTVMRIPCPSKHRRSALTCPAAKSMT